MYIKVKLIKKDITTDGRVFYQVELPNGNVTNIKEEDIELSDCCSAEVYEDFKGNDNNSGLIEIVRCEKCKCECQIVP